MIVPLPWERPPVTLNDRDERNRGGSQKIKKALREAREAVRAAGLEPIVSADSTLHWQIPDRRRRDSDNLGSTHKIVNDALVKELVIPDDSWSHIRRSTQEIHPPNGEPASMWLELSHITRKVRTA